MADLGGHDRLHHRGQAGVARGDRVVILEIADVALDFYTSHSQDGLLDESGYIMGILVSVNGGIAGVDALAND